MDALRLKILLSVFLIVLGAVSVPFFAAGSSASESQASGLLIDFEDWEATWTEMDVRSTRNPYDALTAACAENDYSLSVEDGKIREINGVYSNDEFEWDLWTISPNSMTWVKAASPQDTDISDFTITAWAYCDGKRIPTVAVDETGRPIYGYPQAGRTISLSPALTEIIGSLKAVTTLVGTDRYSNYPAPVTAGHDDGRIKIVGDFLNPSFELIAGQRPDMVFCDGSLYTHHEVAERLRNANINSVLMYGGESIREIMCNIYIAGVAIGYDMRADEVIDLLETAQKDMADAMNAETAVRDTKVMVALSPDKSPWVTGSGTFVNDLAVSAMGSNVHSSKNGWVHINSELVMSSDPSVILILTTDYAATEEEYNMMLGSLSSEWKATDAYRNGEIYLICENAGEMSQCPSPRFVQLMEITARILQPNVFTDTVMPKYIGDDYESILTFTKYLGFND